MDKLQKNLESIYQALMNKEFVAKLIGDRVHPDYRLSAMNLVRYITLRNRDLRNVHDHLSELGISSLRSCEAYVFQNVTAALTLVNLLNGKKWSPNENVEFVGYKKSRRLQSKHSKQLFQLPKSRPTTKIMVTMPTEAAENKELVRTLLREGMNIARINLSHDDEEVWIKMVKNIKQQSALLDLDCKIYMDLSGPKIRTGCIEVDCKKGPKEFIKLQIGEHLILGGPDTSSLDTIYGKKGELVQMAHIGVSLPNIIAYAKVGDRIFFDDGKMETKVIQTTEDSLEVIVVKTPPKGMKLKGGKGINLPDTDLHLPSLTEDDMKNIPIVKQYADIVGYSFVRKPEDVQMLHHALENYGAENIGIVLKIENQEAFENLPIILLHSMKKRRVGVMIARGDLAVEVGPERIAEIQDEILWICEAAHIPVIWATQVLDSLAKKGLATRSEITDAAKGAEAECVMLNKGKYIDEATTLLKNILSKMESHTNKKKSVMRALKISELTIDKIGQQLMEVD